MTTVFYTYLYLSEDGQPYYIDKGARNRVFSSKHRVPVLSADRIILEPHTSEEDALAAEMFLVAYYGRQDKGTGCLLNKSDGGEISSKSGLQFRQLVRRVLLDIVKNPRSTNREKLEAVKIWKEIKK